MLFICNEYISLKSKLEFPSFFVILLSKLQQVVLKLQLTILLLQFLKIYKEIAKIKSQTVQQDLTHTFQQQGFLTRLGHSMFMFKNQSPLGPQCHLEYISCTLGKSSENPTVQLMITTLRFLPKLPLLARDFWLSKQKKSGTRAKQIFPRYKTSYKTDAPKGNFREFLKR